MSRIHVFTSAAANYAPKVRTLFDLLRRHRPEWKLHVALADFPERAADLDRTGADHVHTIDGLDIPHWRQWAFSHVLIELATAIKPFVLKKILQRADCDAAIYLDPDILVLSPLAEVAGAFSHSDILLTPHLTVPENNVDGIVSNEICTMQHGIYNLGFIGVRAGDAGRAFADYWADRTYRFGREDIPNGIYTDQRWIDFVPSYFDRVAVLRSPALNVGPWNLDSRPISGNIEDGFYVGETPLGFFHFSQIDLAVHDGLFARAPSVARLVEWYRRETTPGANDAPTSKPWSMSQFADGTAIAREQRLVYRLRPDLQATFPDPFDAGPHSYPAWWKGRARQEYPDLFNPASKAKALRDLADVLTFRRVANEFGS